MINEELINKIKFVEGLNNAIVGNIPNITKISYDVFTSKVGDFYQEFVVLEYKGGCIQARNCYANSNLAILEEISKMGYTSQLYCRDTETYKELLKSENWVKL